MSENMADLAIPEIKLVQNTGGDEAKQLGALPGDFYCAITQEVFKNGLDIVVMKPAQKTRTYWGRTDIDDEPPVCASADGILSINGEDCATKCPYAAFTDAPYMIAAAERRAKCLPNYNIIAINLSDMMPVMIRASGMSAMAARELNTLMKFHKVMRGQPFKAKIKVSSIKKKTPSGDAFAIKFGNPELITDEETINELKSMVIQLTGVETLPEALPVPNSAPALATTAEPTAAEAFAKLESANRERAARTKELNF